MDYDLLEGILPELQERYNNQESIFTEELIHRWRVPFKQLDKLENILNEQLQKNEISYSEMNDLVVNTYKYSECLSLVDQIKILQRIQLLDVTGDFPESRDNRAISYFDCLYEDGSRRNQNSFGDMTALYPGIVRFRMVWLAKGEDGFGFVRKSNEVNSVYTLATLDSHQKDLIIREVDTVNEQSDFGAYILYPNTSLREPNEYLYLDKYDWEINLKLC